MIKRTLLSLLIFTAPGGLFAQQQQLASISYAPAHTITVDNADNQLHFGSNLTRRQLMAVLKQIDVNDAAYNETNRAQLYQLAGMLTHMKLYALAMKCFFRTLGPDSLVNGNLALTDKDQQTIESHLKPDSAIKDDPNSRFVDALQITDAFHDGKKAMAYAMIFHVRQPVRGKPKVHKLAYTGHTYVTLIKFNTDSSYASMTFGFGPKKDNLLSATPLEPSSTSTLRDDLTYPWDEVVGKFISRRRFEKILLLAQQYQGLAYQLNKNNCTDFGLKAAQLAGLEVKDTKAKWLLGGGNNPGTTGESILLGKFSNTDTGNFDRLLIDTARTSPLTVVQADK